jgi:hypothetical protein
MSIEDEVRQALRNQAAHAPISEDAWAQIGERMQDPAQRQFDRGPRPRHRGVIVAVAFALFAAASVLVWSVFAPGTGPGSVAGWSRYQDPNGWSMRYPSSWHLTTFRRVCLADFNGAMVSNVPGVYHSTQSPQSCYWPPNMASLPPDGVVVEFDLMEGGPVSGTTRSTPDTPFPLSLPALQPAPTPGTTVRWYTQRVQVDGNPRYTLNVWIGPEATEPARETANRIVASISFARGSGETSSTSTAVVRSDGTFRCTVTFPHLPMTPGALTGAAFSLQNVTGKPERVNIGVNGDVGYLVFASDGTKLQDSSRLHEGIRGPIPPRRFLKPGGTMQIGTEDTAILWPGPLQVTPVCMGKRLPTVTLPVASPGAPSSATVALDQAVNAFASRFESCRPRQSGVWVRGTISGRSGTFDARCAGLVISHPGFDVVVLATVAPPDAPSVDLAQLSDRIEAAPTFSFPKGSTIRLSWWVTVVTSRGTSCSRAVSVSISPKATSSSAGMQCAGMTVTGG